MARKRNADNPANNGSIPQRVEDAARNMMNQTAGPSRGYVPQRPQQPQGGWQQVPPGFYPGQMPQQNNAYYAGQQQPLNGGQRGYTVPNGNQGKPKRPRKKHPILLTICLLLLAGALGTGAYFSITEQVRTRKINDKVEAYNNYFCPGIYVDGINLGGMTPEQALNSVNSQIQQRHDAWKVQLTYNEQQVLEINADMMGFSVDTQSVLYKAWAKGHTGDNEQRYAEMLELEENPYNDYTAQPDGNTHVIDEKLMQIKEAIDKPAVNAAMTQFDPNQEYPFVFKEEEYGRNLDIEPIRQKLYQMVSTMESGTVELVPDVVPPTVFRSDLIMNYKVRGYATTEISRHSEENRNNNIRLAFDYVNSYGSIIEPNATFSFNKVVGKRSPERGFFPATEYVYGEHEEGYGGGVCQASTTIFQAAVRAGMQILDRRPHSDSVSYTEYGKDATVYWSEFRGGKKIDFSFRNTSDAPIYIVAHVKTIAATKKEKKKLICEVTIYGKDMGSTSYDIDTVEEVIPCTLNPVPVADKELVAKAKDGCKVDVYFVEYTNGVETGRKKMYQDKYEPKAERYYDPYAKR
ncbi:MAG: VanW family protein [Clostridia bacterium]|nr:VanW family protein [Clostridia bacterium]